MDLLGARNPTTGRDAADTLTSERLDVRFVEVDVTRIETISAAGARTEAGFGKLDVLVNNAGIADPHDGPPSRASVDVIERVLGTNFLGAVAMAQAVLPLLRKSEAGRIVNVSSDLGSITRMVIQRGSETTICTAMSYPGPALAATKSIL